MNQRPIYIYIETIKYWWKKSKMTQIDGAIYHVHGWINIVKMNQYNENADL